MQATGYDIKARRKFRSESSNWDRVCSRCIDCLENEVSNEVGEVVRLV